MSNRPDWCPADVWGVAEEYTVGLRLSIDLDAYNYPIVLEATAHAILAERERCSKIAGSELRNRSMLMSNPPQSGAAWDIRNAIDAGTPAP